MGENNLDEDNKNKAAVIYEYKPYIFHKEALIFYYLMILLVIKNKIKIYKNKNKKREKQTKNLNSFRKLNFANHVEYIYLIMFLVII